MSDTERHGLVVLKGTMEDCLQLLAEAINNLSCPFCHGKGLMALGISNGKTVERICNPCAGIGLLHPERVKVIKERFNTGGENA